MKTLLLSVMLLATPMLAYSQTLFKIDADALVCMSPEPIIFLEKQIVENDIGLGTITEIVTFLVDENECLIPAAGILYL